MRTVLLNKNRLHWLLRRYATKETCLIMHTTPTISIYILKEYYKEEEEEEEEEELGGGPK
jgi:hypothetical protein